MKSKIINRTTEIRVEYQLMESPPKADLVSANSCSLLIVDHEPYTLGSLSAVLADRYDLATARSAEVAREVFQRRRIDMILANQKMPGESGVELLEWVQKFSPLTVRLLMAEYAQQEDAIEAVNRGKVYHYLLKPYRIEELQQVLQAAAEKVALQRNRAQLLGEMKRLNEELERQVELRTRELQAANHLLQQRLRELETLALTDPLTGLPNRRAIDDIARVELRRHARYGSPVALGVIDADNFRDINRQYLLPGGDQALIHLAKTLTSSLRTVDSVGRIGGEEFLVVAPETGTEGAAVLAERIRANVESRPASYKGQSIPLTVSIGFAAAESGIPAEFEQIKHTAAAALGEAKALGRNRCIVRSLTPG